jgi:hypothetical protein
MSRLTTLLLEMVAHPTSIAITSIASIVLFVGTLAGIPWFVARLPVDYFKRAEDHPSAIAKAPLRIAFHVGKNLLGGLLLLMGIAMLVLPGQGLLTIVVALVLLDFPGKRRLERRIVSRPRVLGALNALRRRAGREPLLID